MNPSRNPPLQRRPGSEQQRAGQRQTARLHVGDPSPSSTPLGDATNQPAKRRRSDETSQTHAAAPDASLRLGPDWLGNEKPYTQPGNTPDPYLTFSAPLPSQFPNTPFSASTGPLALSNKKWGLKREVVLGFKAVGIDDMYPWQAECLLLPGLLSGETNVVYTAPTSAGKSLVADLLVIKQVVEKRKKAIIVLPYIAIVQEKARFLKKVLANLRVEITRRSENTKPRYRAVNVVGFHSGARTRIGWKELDIAICTIEKANALVNAAVEDHTIGNLGTVVFDELHMLEDESRGYVLELLATKLLCIDNMTVQIVGMSATLSVCLPTPGSCPQENIKTIAAWLKAHPYECHFRPVPLQEHLVYNNSVYTYKQELVANISQAHLKEAKNPVTNAIISLAYNAMVDDHGVLVFCESRKHCEDLANLLVQVAPRASEELAEKRMEIIRNLATTPTGIDPLLEKVVPAGVAFHHAGLTTEERDIIAEAYDQGYIKCICCTPTMAAGVNLPARRVIICPRTGLEFLKPAMLRQMRGRAGRAGKDTYGESYLCCKREELPEVEALLAAEMPAVTSCLASGTSDSNQGLARALLEIIATRLATSDYSIKDYFQSTLLYHTHPEPSALPALLESSLEGLKRKALIEEGDFGLMSATLCGRATVAAGFPPDEGVFLHAELSRALKNFNLETDLHIVYHFTPTHATTERTGDIDWQILRREVERLDEPDLRTASFIGVSPAFVNKMAQGTTSSASASAEKLRVYKRFFVSLMLREIITESALHLVAARFAVARGFLQSLASTSRGFATTSATFCRVMGWTGLAVLLEHYAWRLEAGVRDELAQLARIPWVKSATARVFWENGLRAVEDVVKADVDRVAELLRMARPRRVRLGQVEEGKLRDVEMQRARVVVAAAKRIWEADCVVELSE